MYTYEFFINACLVKKVKEECINVFLVYKETHI